MSQHRHPTLVHTPIDSTEVGARMRRMPCAHHSSCQPEQLSEVISAGLPCPRAGFLTRGVQDAAARRWRHAHLPHASVADMVCAERPPLHLANRARGETARSLLTSYDRPGWHEPPAGPLPTPFRRPDPRGVATALCHSYERRDDAPDLSPSTIRDRHVGWPDHGRHSGLELLADSASRYTAAARRRRRLARLRRGAADGCWTVVGPEGRAVHARSSPRGLRRIDSTSHRATAHGSAASDKRAPSARR